MFSAQQLLINKALIYLFLRPKGLKGNMQKESEREREIGMERIIKTRLRCVKEESV